ncbi:MAG: peptidase M19 [Anaerolineales bacterium]|nr:peptidase M19 [Anaerolineales bacterium]
MTLPLIVDAHEDLAWNILAFNRDYTRPVAETRRLETESNAPALLHEGHTLLGVPEYRQGRVAVVFATLFASPAKARQDWDPIYYADFEQAHRLYRDQIDLYHELADRHPGDFRLIGNRTDLDSVLADWADPSAKMHPVGLVPLMEGAEGVRSPAELDLWWQAGVRIIGLAWAGTRFCGGTREPGPLTEEGRQLLKAMADFGFTLDISHMDELSARQSLDCYPGPVIASHANAAGIIPEYSGNRHLPDSLIKALIARDGIIGLVPSCKFLNYGWKRGDARSDVTLAMAAAHFDHICQIAGSARHVGFGTDFDGGFGLDAVPGEFDSIADLQKFAPLLSEKGYPQAEIEAIFGGNWIRHLQVNLPK